MIYLQWDIFYTIIMVKFLEFKSQWTQNAAQTSINHEQDLEHTFRGVRPAGNTEKLIITHTRLSAASSSVLSKRAALLKSFMRLRPQLEAGVSKCSLRGKKNKLIPVITAAQPQIQPFIGDNTLKGPLSRIQLAILC